MIPIYESKTELDRNDTNTNNDNKSKDVIDKRKAGGMRKLIRIDGLLGNLIDQIRNNLKFDIDFLPVQGFGVKTDNGTYNGVLGMVQTRVSEGGEWT